MLQTAWPTTRLKFKLKNMVAGGTPRTDNTLYYKGEGMIPWVAIGDMTGRDVVEETAKSVTPIGLTSAGIRPLPKGTLLFAMYASLGTTAFLGVEAATNQAILGLICDAETDRKFLRFWLKALQPHLVFYSRSNTQDNLNAEVVGNLPFPSLHWQDQRRIADFLDRETGRLDALMGKKRRLIELLEEKRTALISHAVTKGLDPTVPMNDSGIPWLGEVPAHWEVTKLTSVVDIAEGQVDPTIEPYASLPLIAPNHVRSGVGELSDVTTASEQGAVSGKYLCRPGDVIYSKIRPALRKVALAPGGCLCSADMYPMRARRDLRPGFLRWWLLGDRFSAWAELVSERVAMPKVNREALTEVRLALPPLDEQAAIDRWLREHMGRSGRVIRLIDTQLDKLAEYRQALITAAVTGQIDVDRFDPDDELGKVTG